MNRPTVLCVIQARSGSTRLPGKVLAEISGRPLLRFMIDRLLPAPADSLVVATTTAQRDDPVAQVAQAGGVAVVRGSEVDVLGRFMAALDLRPADHVIRLTADCPLTDRALVRAVLDRHLETGADYTTNCIPRTFPKGLDVEVVRADALARAAAEASDAAEREHVTPFFYRHPELFRLANLRHSEPLGDERWTVDTAADLAFVRQSVALLGTRWDAGWEQVLAVAGRQARVPLGELHLRPAFPRDRDLLLAWRNDPLTVRNSIRSEQVPEEDHRTWFDALLCDPGRRLWIGEIDGVPIGQVRIDVEAAVGEVSITVAPDHRGRGHGQRLLEALIVLLRDDLQALRLRARIRPDNIASRRLFERVGFVLVAADERFDVCERQLISVT